MNKLKIIIPTILVVAGIGGTAYASQAAKPGDTLFPIKKATEQVQVSLALSDQAKAGLQNKFARERLQELNEIENENQAGVQNQTNTDAQAQAKLELSNAINTLTEVKADLQAKGNTVAANAIGETILRLQAKLDSTTSAGSNAGTNNTGSKDQNSTEPEDQNNQEDLKDNCNTTSVCGTEQQNDGDKNNVNLKVNGSTQLHFDNGSGGESQD